ncbi:hypothetical protein [Bradyrhizobium sp. cf659]|uniref:hypothetical protein n=1 Tax=Bradyrhizobium sp. cf659 TaxID=1761771 RepID=UPI0008EA09C9|nr:hypothetical protein [Bradyrhizobium sp. cf659]SFI26883.1 hypothetical protein SAMN04487925_102488 [Bradyrhizobium sp. cf659]
MLTSGTTRPSLRTVRQGAARGDVSAGSVPLFTADEAWSRAIADWRAAGETDDRDSLLEPGFWMTALVAFLPTVAGCLYLFLTQG